MSALTEAEAERLRAVRERVAAATPGTWVTDAAVERWEGTILIAHAGGTDGDLAFLAGLVERLAARVAAAHEAGRKEVIEAQIRSRGSVVAEMYRRLEHAADLVARENARLAARVAELEAERAAGAGEALAYSERRAEDAATEERAAVVADLRAGAERYDRDGTVFGVRAGSQGTALRAAANRYAAAEHIREPRPLLAAVAAALPVDPEADALVDRLVREQGAHRAGEAHPYRAWCAADGCGICIAAEHRAGEADRG